MKATQKHTLVSSYPPCLNTIKGGFSHTRGKDWNACVRKINGFLRVPLDFQKNIYLTPSSARSHGHSIALIPNRMKGNHPYLLLYLHGLNHQVVNEKPLSIPRLEYDRFPEQIQQSGHGRDLISLFPLADPEVLFPPESPNYSFSISSCLSEELSQLKLKLSSDKLPLILMAHSSGGSVLHSALLSNPFPKLKAAIFLDGINGEKEVPFVQEYLTHRILKQISWLKEEHSLQEQTQYFQSIPRFFFYYTHQYISYPKAHQQLASFLQRFWQKQTQNLPKTKQALLTKLQKYYRLISLDKKVTHSNIMRSGVIQRVLRQIPSQAS